MYVLQHTFNIQLGNLQIHLSPYFLFEQSLKVNQTWVFRAFSGLFWAFAPPWACMCPFRFPGICGNFSKTLFSKVSYCSVFPPRLFGVSIVCPNCHFFPQVAAANKLSFKCFWQMPSGYSPLPGTSFELGGIRKSPLHQFFRVPPDRLKHTNTILWGQGPFFTLWH